MNEEITLQFVLSDDHSDESETTPEMRMTFDTCHRRYGMTPSWIKESDCRQIDLKTLTKQNVFVFEDFKGLGFDHLEGSRALLLGTRCLLTCVTQDQNIPLGSSPVYSTAMRENIICMSGLNKEEKIKVKKLVEWMGGICTEKLSVANTHLISNTTSSIKYARACALMPVMHVDWVEAVWQATRADDTLGNCDEFIKRTLNKYRLPIFYRLNITSTQLKRNEKLKIEGLIEGNGGKYMGNFSGAITDYLVLHNAVKENAKYQGAVTSRKECVTPLWVEKSVEVGYCLPVEGPYKVNKIKCSTPTKEDTSTHPDFSSISVISCPNASKINVNETIENSICSHGATSETLKGLNISEIKRAGSFLDGIGIYLSGFTHDDREILNKIINYGSATRYDTMSDRVTHILVGKTVQSDLEGFTEKQLTPHVVNIKWLVDSIKLKQPAPEGKYLNINEVMEPASPMSKKNLQMMRPRTLPPVPKFNLDRKESEQCIVQQYVSTIPLQDNAGSTSGSNNQNDEDSYDQMSDSETMVNLEFLAGVTFFLCTPEEDDDDDIEKYIEEYSGTVVDSKDAAQYLIVPLVGPEISAPDTALVVTKLWLIDTVNSQCILSVKYYHLPIIEPKETPLDGVVFAITNYTGVERQYLTALGEVHGATFSDNFVRKTSKEKGLLASTHLICSEMFGDKYNASVRWKVPAVTSEWMLQCANTCSLVSVTPYLVGYKKEPANESCGQTLNTFVENQGNAITPGTVDVNLKVKRKRILSASDENWIEITKNDFHSPKMVKSVTPQASKATPITPFNRHLHNMLDTSTPCSQVTPPPVSKILQSLRYENEGTPDSPGLPPTPGRMRTPDTPYGAIIFPNPSPETRKRWKKYCDNIPTDMYQPVKERKPNTPWSVVKKRAWDAMCPGFKTPETIGNRLEESNIDPKKLEISSIEIPLSCENQKIKQGINTQLQLLNQILTSGCSVGSPNTSVAKVSSKMPSEYSLDRYDKIETGSDIVAKESQAESVGWRDPSEIAAQPNKNLLEVKPFRKRPPKFMLSGVDAREELAEMIASLGGSVSDRPEFDETCSHLLCERPGRTEKLLCAMASGKWVLCSSYVLHCMQNGSFINEESHEWGNPLAEFPKLSDVDKVQDAIYRWRTKLNNGQNNDLKQGAFIDFKVIINVDKREQFERLIKAGGGEVLQVRSPYTEVKPGMATHYFHDRKNEVKADEIRHLTRCGVYCLPVTYLAKFLVDVPQPDPREEQITV